MGLNTTSVEIIDDKVSQTEVACSTSAVTALAANPDRRGALLINDSDVAIYIKLGATAVAAEGLRINANGGSIEFNEVGGPHFTGLISAIAASGSGKNLLVMEY